MSTAKYLSIFIISGQGKSGSHPTKVYNLKLLKIKADIEKLVSIFGRIKQDELPGGDELQLRSFFLTVLKYNAQLNKTDHQ